MKGVLPETKMKPGVAMKGSDTKPKGSMKRKPMSTGGRLSPFADVSSKNPLGYGAK